MQKPAHGSQKVDSSLNHNIPTCDRPISRCYKTFFVCDCSCESLIKSPGNFQGF